MAFTTTIYGNTRIAVSTGTSATLAARTAELINAGFSVLGYGGSASNPTIVASAPVEAPPPPPPAPIDCVLSDWSAWTPTSDWSTCLNGSQSRTETRSRTVVTAPANGGLPCGPTTESRTVTQACTVTPPPPPPPTDAIFFSGWENTTETGCTLNGLLDGGLWGDFGPAFPGLCPLAQVVVKDGSRRLQVTQMPGNQNGTDFRIEKTIGMQSEITVSWDQMFAPEFRFATGDHKMLIVGGGGGQNVYANIRGNSADPTQGRITVHVIPVDTAMSDPAVPIRVGQWYNFKLNVKAGSNGYVRFKVNGQQLTLRTEAGNQANPLALNTGAIDFIKPDTTYNIGSFITAPWNVWYDNVTVTAGSAAF